MTTSFLKGFNVVLSSEYDKIPNIDKLDYLWFVRDSKESKIGKIYLGSRLYSAEATDEDFSKIKSDIDKINIVINEINTRLDSFDSNHVLLVDMVNAEIERSTRIDNNMQTSIDDLNNHKVSYMSNDDHRIVLDNHKNLLGTATNGSTYNLAMVSKWDVADFGTPNLQLNLNSIEIPTVQLPGQTGDQAKHIALAEDIATSIETLMDQDQTIIANVNIIDTKFTNEINSIKSNVSNSFDDINSILNDDIKPKILSHETLITKNANDIVIEKERAELVETTLSDQISGITNNITTLTQKDIDLGTQLSSKISKVALTQDQANPLHYTLFVDDVKNGEINIPKDQFLKSVNFVDDTNEIVFVFETMNGDNEVKLDISKFVDKYNVGDGLSLVNNSFSVKLDSSGQSYFTVSSNGLKLAGIDEALNIEKTIRTTEISELRNDLSTEITRAQTAEQANTDVITNITGSNRILSNRISEFGNPNPNGEVIRLTDRITNKKIGDIISPMHILYPSQCSFYDELTFLEILTSDTTIELDGSIVDLSGLTAEHGPYLVLGFKDLSNITDTPEDGGTSIFNLKAYSIKPSFTTNFVLKSDYDALVRRIEALEIKL